MSNGAHRYELSCSPSFSVYCKDRHGNSPKRLGHNQELSQKKGRHTVLSSPKKAHKHKEMGSQNWTLDPTPKTPLDPPPRNSLCTVFCWENQHLHKEFGRLSPLLDPPARVPPKFFMQIFFGFFFPFVILENTISNIELSDCFGALTGFRGESSVSSS